MLDEPLISLDARHQEVAIDVVRKVCRARKITVLFSAHELNQLLGTLDRVLYLGNRHAVLGAVDEVVTAPVLSRLYGTDIHVVRAGGAYFRHVARQRCRTRGSRARSRRAWAWAWALSRRRACFTSPWRGEVASRSAAKAGGRG